jgi:hypothetical protein
MRQLVDVNTGTDQYRQQGDYAYGSERDTSQQQRYASFERTPDASQAQLVPSQFASQDDILEPETVIEHISEDEKSTSSEEVVFEEWTEQFKCRRTDEYDRKTNRLLRTTIDETSDRIKGDVIKEQYKEKTTRIKKHKSYDVVKEVYRRAPARVYEEVPQIQRPTSKDRHWASEETYTTEIVHDPNLAKELESTAQKYDQIRSIQYSPIPSTTETIISTFPTTVTPKQEEIVSEEYHVELQTPVKHDETTSDTYVSTRRRSSDWRDKLKQLYTTTSDDDQVNEKHF